MSMMKNGILDRSARTLHMGCGEQLSVCEALLSHVQKQENRSVGKSTQAKREVKR